MPVSDQANQMSMLQAAMQQALAQQQMGPMMQRLAQPPQQLQQPATSPTGQGQGLGALLGGVGALGQQQQAQPPQQPQTLGFNQPIPMQLPQADPTGQQQAQAPDIAYGMSMGDIPAG